MEFKIINLDLVDYKQAYELQKSIFEEIKNRHFNAALILCRHHPVVTFGRQARKDNIRVTPQELEKTGIGFFRIERGGDVTYHGPGQIVAYPIFDLAYFKKDIHLFLRNLEDVGIGLLSDLGIKGVRRKGFTGVWIGAQKIASIGIAIRNWITFHGMSINIRRDDLTNFKLIRPCGLDIEMTCLEAITGKSIKMDYLNTRLISRFKETFLIPG